MARIRSLKPEFWADFPTGKLSRDARMLYIALWNFADEHARLAGDPRYVKGAVFPYDDDLDTDAVDGLLAELADAARVVRYTDVDGSPYLYLPTLAKHQRLEPAKVPSRHPDPPEPTPPPGRADSSEPRADSSARNPNPQAVENQPTGSETASSQVRAPEPARAEKSARDADSSTLLYVAGSMEHGCSSSAPAPTRTDQTQQLPPPVAILRSKLNARRMVVRWDKLTDAQLDQIAELTRVHGDEPLIKTALASYQPASPPVMAQAWLAGWAALPKPGDTLAAVDDPPCTQPGHLGTTRRCTECITEARAAR